MQGVNVSVTLDGIATENFTTNENGVFNGSFNIPYDISPGNYGLYAAFNPLPGSSLGASSAGPVFINLTDSGSKIVVEGMPPLLFRGESLNVTGTLTTGNGMPIAGKA